MTPLTLGVKGPICNPYFKCHNHTHNSFSCLHTAHIGKREKGMAFNTMNFHGTKHISEQILWFGVPLVSNTMANEQHHKRDKKSAKRTNQRPDTFDISVARKIHERNAIDFAIQELEGRPRWEYYQGFDHSERQVDNEFFEPTLTGTKTQFFFDEITAPGVVRHKVFSKMRSKDKYRYDYQTFSGLCEILEFYKEDFNDSPNFYAYSELKVHNELYEKGRIVYRASPYHEGRPWYDWGMFNLSTVDAPDVDDWVAGHIKAFVDLTNLKVWNDDGRAPGLYVVCID